MNWEFSANPKLIESLGWTLLHSLWQIALIAFILFLFRRAAPRFSANFRYLMAVLTLVFAVALPVATFAGLYSQAPSNLPSGGISGRDGDAAVQKIQRRAESFPVLPKEAADGEAFKNEGVLTSFENLRSAFRENFSAVLPFAVGLWFGGVALFGVRLAGGVWQLHLYRTHKLSEPEPEWRERFTELCEKLKITSTVRLFRSNLIETPIVVGWLKPVILIPASVFLQITPRELETIVAHELVHIRRCDAFVNFVQNAAEVLFFYHPCLWWISGVIRREREFAADAAVIEIFENSRIVYASALANLESIRSQANQTLPRYATAANGGNLMQRIREILQKNTEIKRSASAWSAGLACALISAVLLAVLSFNQTTVVNAQKQRASKRLAIGFVSIPPVGYQTSPPIVVRGNLPEASDATARLLIEKLKTRHIPAIGFVLGGVISDGENLHPERADILRLWRDAGLEIGIGNFRHLWFYDTPYEDFVAGVEKNEAITRKILDEKNLPLKYFSYPYLNTGRTAADRDRFENWLQARGLTPVKYTIDNQEWMYSYAYEMARARHDLNAMGEIRAGFVRYMTEMFDHFEAYSQEMFGRDIAQTMVLTPSRLVADSADDLFGMIEKRGYKFVSMNEALADDAYKTDESFVNTRERIGKSGISWFERWQIAQGKKLRDEPKVDDNVQKIWNEMKPKSK